MNNFKKYKFFLSALCSLVLLSFTALTLHNDYYSLKHVNTHSKTAYEIKAIDNGLSPCAKTEFENTQVSAAASNIAEKFIPVLDFHFVKVGFEKSRDLQYLIFYLSIHHSLSVKDIIYPFHFFW